MAADSDLEAIKVYWPLLRADKAAPALRDSLLIGWIVPERRRIKCFAVGNFGDSNIHTTTTTPGKSFVRVNTQSKSRGPRICNRKGHDINGIHTVAEACISTSDNQGTSRSPRTALSADELNRASNIGSADPGTHESELAPDDTPEDYIFIDYLNIIVAGYVNLTTPNLRPSQILELCKELGSLEGMDESMRSSVTLVGSLFVDGMVPAADVRSIMQGRSHWLDMEVVMESSWPRVETLWLGNDRVTCKNATDIIFYQYPSGSFSYSSSLLDTVSLLRSVRSDAISQIGRIVETEHRAESPEYQEKNAGEDPFELVLKRLNVSDRISAMGQNWKFFDDLPSNESDCSVARRSRGRRRRIVRNMELFYSGPILDNTPVTPDGRAAVDTSHNWVVLMINMVRSVIMPLCTIIGSLCTLMMSVKIPCQPWCLLMKQAHTRIRACAQWPTICIRMRQLKTQSTPILLGYNMILMSSIVSFFLDIMLGWLIHYILMKHPHAILDLLHQAYNFLHIDVLKAQIDWLMGFPAGLKLNDRLSFFIGEILLASVDKWNQLSSLLAPMELAFLKSAALIPLCGASFLVAAALDILAFCTLHVFYIYVFVSQLTRVSLKLLQSLSYLFRERKWNVLRLRVDSCEYGVDQLLIGSIAFTCLLMLFPTVLVFYLSFASIWLIILLTQLMLQFVLAALNHFPIYLLLLKIGPGPCIPSGVTIRPIGSKTNTAPVGLKSHYQVCYWFLDANSVSIRDGVAAPFAASLKVQFAKFNPRTILSSLLTGKIVHLHAMCGPTQLPPGQQSDGRGSNSPKALSNELKPFRSVPRPREETGFSPFLLDEFKLTSSNELLSLIWKRMHQKIMALVGLCDVALNQFCPEITVHGNKEKAWRDILRYLDHVDLIRLSRTNSVLKLAVKHYCYEALANEWQLVYPAAQQPLTVWGLEFDLLRARASSLFVLEQELAQAKQFSGLELQSAGEICEYFRDQKSAQQQNDSQIYVMMTNLVRRTLTGILKHDLRDEEKAVFKQLLAIAAKDPHHQQPTIIHYFSQFVHALPRIYKDISRSQRDALYTRSLLINAANKVHTQLQAIFAQNPHNKRPYEHDIQLVQNALIQSPFLKLTPEESKNLANKRQPTPIHQPQLPSMYTPTANTAKVPLPTLARPFDAPIQAHRDGSYSFVTQQQQQLKR